MKKNKLIIEELKLRNEIHNSILLIGESLDIYLKRVYELQHIRKVEEAKLNLINLINKK